MFTIRLTAAFAFAMAGLSPAAAATLEEMAGQMVVVGFQGDEATDASVAALREDLAAGVIGGVMYLRTNVKSLDAVKAMNTAFREASPDLLPFITVDQEGGAVERLTQAVGFSEVPSAADVAANNSVEEAEAIYAQMAAGLADLGFTVNFGPVADINLNPSNQVIGRFGRAFGTDAATVTAYDQAFIDAHHAAGLLTALKHFPGHGSSAGDSHDGFVDITNTWQPLELDPYTSLIESGYQDFVMVGHLYQGEFLGAAEQPPASLSAGWIQLTLRGDLGFKGVVISDDLEMGAIRRLYSTEETVVMAVNAGMDVLLYSNTADYIPHLGKRIRDVLVAEAQADPAFAARITESYERIVELKGRMR